MISKYKTDVLNLTIAICFPIKLLSLNYRNSILQQTKQLTKTKNMAKNIVIFSDGTGQKGGIGSNTNVYKLFNMIEDRTSRQIAFYDSGLGTDWRKVTEFLFRRFLAEDDIYLFGFSRGAGTVRSLTGFLHLFGILPRSRKDLIHQALKILEKSKNHKKGMGKLSNHIVKTPAIPMRQEIPGSVRDRSPPWVCQFH